MNALMDEVFGFIGSIKVTNIISLQSRISCVNNSQLQTHWLSFIFFIIEWPHFNMATIICHLINKFNPGVVCRRKIVTPDFYVFLKKQIGLEEAFSNICILSAVYLILFKT